jgi:hypothetical protein
MLDCCSFAEHCRKAPVAFHAEEIRARADFCSAGISAWALCSIPLCLVHIGPNDRFAVGPWAHSVVSKTGYRSMFEIRDTTEDPEANLLYICERYNNKFPLMFTVELAVTNVCSHCCLSGPRLPL